MEYMVTMQDITSPQEIEVVLSADGMTLWINNEEKCIFRATKIQHLTLKDNRVKR